MKEISKYVISIYVHIPVVVSRNYYTGETDFYLRLLKGFIILRPPLTSQHYFTLLVGCFGTTCATRSIAGAEWVSMEWVTRLIHRAGGGGHRTGRTPASPPPGDQSVQITFFIYLTEDTYSRSRLLLHH